MKKIVTEKDIEGTQEDKAYMVLEGSVKADNALMRYILQSKGAGASAYALYLVLLSHMKANGKRPYPSVRKIAKECGLSRKTVDKYLDVLSELGVLIVKQSDNGGTNQYYFPAEDYLVKQKKSAAAQKKKRKALPKDDPCKNGTDRSARYSEKTNTGNQFLLSDEETDEEPFLFSDEESDEEPFLFSDEETYEEPFLFSDEV